MKAYLNFDQAELDCKSDSLMNVRCIAEPMKSKLIDAVKSQPQAWLA